MLFQAIFGDWSDDGHGKTQTFILDVTGFDSNDQIKGAYERAKARYGRGVEDVANEYEDSSAPIEWIKQMKDEGLTGVVSDETLDDAEEELTSSVYVRVTDLAKIMIHMIKTELPGFEAKIVELPVFVGGYDNVLGTREFFGYGSV